MCTCARACGESAALLVANGAPRHRLERPLQESQGPNAAWKSTSFSPPLSISLHAATFVPCVSSYSYSLHECVCARVRTCARTCVNSASPLKLKTLSCLLSAAVNKHFPLFPYPKSWQSHSTVDTCACVRALVCVCQNHQGLIKDCLPA